VPKPIYSKEAENFCAGGKVEVEVLVDEKGDVFGARAISGDELLHNSAVEVALKAKFTENKTLPFKNRGTISFDLLQILQNVLMQEL
jgi:outer membrane biosynthesis protein TonB